MNVRTLAERTAMGVASAARRDTPTASRSSPGPGRSSSRPTPAAATVRTGSSPPIPAVGPGQAGPRGRRQPATHKALRPGRRSSRRRWPRVIALSPSCPTTRDGCVSRHPDDPGDDLAATPETLWATGTRAFRDAGAARRHPRRSRGSRRTSATAWTSWSQRFVEQRDHCEGPAA